MLNLKALPIKSGALLLSVGITGMLSAPAHAALVNGVTASTDMGAAYITDIRNTVNGVGLSSLDLNATHAPTSPRNSWVADFGRTTGTITFNLHALYNLAGFSFWNQNAGGPGPIGTTGIKGVTVQTSTNGINFSDLLGGPTQFSQVASSFSLPEKFSFAPTSASIVRFLVNSNWGDSSTTGFAEVQFDGKPTATAVPTPALLPGLIGMGVAALRKRKREGVEQPSEA